MNETKDTKHSVDYHGKLQEAAEVQNIEAPTEIEPAELTQVAGAGGDGSGAGVGEHP